MKSYQKKTICFLIMFAIGMAFFPLHGVAALVLKTEAVSGTITAIKDGAVELDGDDRLYYPFRKEWKMTLKKGSVVTLLYYIDKSDGEPIRKYTKYAPGANSLIPKAARSKKFKEFE